MCLKTPNHLKRFKQMQKEQMVQELRKPIRVKQNNKSVRLLYYIRNESNSLLENVELITKGRRRVERRKINDC